VIALQKEKTKILSAPRRTMTRRRRRRRREMMWTRRKKSPLWPLSDLKRDQL
jgi:hypothetical protein